MAHHTHVRNELVSDSEATLRQVEGVLRDFTMSDTGDSDLEAMVSEIEVRPTGLAELVKVLVASYSEIMEVIGALRQSRGLLEQASMDRIKSTGVKLQEVSSATETAATGMLDGLDRAFSLTSRRECSVCPRCSVRVASGSPILRPNLQRLPTRQRQTILRVRRVIRRRLRSTPIRDRRWPTRSSRYP